VDESTQTIAPTGDARTEFHMSKPDGWPAGKYKLEVLVNGTTAGTKDFEVTP
jgi:outer membrane usher protein FimD/PapC